MSAEHYGTHLLRDVQQESLAELLSTLRNLSVPQQQTHTSLPCLDKLINQFLQPTTTLIDHRHEYSDDHDQDHYYHQLREPSKSKPILIHIPVSPIDSSSHAATTLLYHLTALSIRSHASVWLVPHFSAPRLLSHSTHLDTSATTTTSNLQHTHILYPTSTSSLLTILRALPDYLFSQTHPSTHRALNLIVIHSIDTYHHQDKFHTDLNRLENQNTHHSNTEVSALKEILAELSILSTRFGCVVIYTSTYTQNKSVLDDHALFNLKVSRSSVPLFAGQMGIEECLGDRERRNEAVRNGVWQFTTNGPEGRTGFDMHINPNGALEFR